MVESGWEMPIVLRALILGVPEEKIWTNWQGVTAEILKEDNLQAAAIGAQVDRIRDEWIAADLEDWLGQHRFYPGIVARLQKLVTEPVEIKIVTTKEGRFVRQLLQQQGINLPDEAILGKEVKRPKHQTLRELLGSSVEHPPRIWFVEDRLKTLQAVSEYPDLAEVQLYLADWGYNTAEMRESVKGDRRIHLLSLSQFAQDFTLWGKWDWGRHGGATHIRDWNNNQRQFRKNMKYTKVNIAYIVGFLLGAFFTNKGLVTMLIFVVGGTIVAVLLEGMSENKE